MNTDDHRRKLADLERISAEQDAEYEAKQANHEARVAELTGTGPILDETDAGRLELLDRLAKRVPEMNLDQHEVEWTTLPDDGAEALVVDGGGFDGGNGYCIANAGDDLHVIGTTAPLIPGRIELVAIHVDGSRELLRVIADPISDEGDEPGSVS